MSFVIKATVYMTAAEYEAVEVKRGDIEYIVDYGDKLLSYVGDIRVDKIDFAEFTEEQKEIIKSWAQEAAEQSAHIAEEAAIAAKASEDAAKASEENAAHYADIASKAQGYDQSAREAALAALKASNASVMAAAKALSERVLAESFTHGNTGAREGENTDNARYYKDLAKAISGDIGEAVQHIEDVSAHVDAVAVEVEADRQDVEGMKDDVTAMKNAAALSEQHAAQSESNALNSANAAAQSESNAAGSAQAALDSENAAEASKNAAALSEQRAAQSESNALGSANAAAQSESNALSSANAAHASEVNAKASEDAAALSERNAAGSATDASNSASAAHTSEVNAKASENAAAGSATAAEQSAISAYNSANSASESATNAHNSEVAAAASENQVAHDAAEAASSAEAAEQSEQDAAAKAVLAESWAVGETGTREGEDTNNAKYWAEQARQASPDGKADKVIGATAGDLAGLDATGNLTDSGIPGDKVARQDGSYDTLHAGTAGNLVDDRAPSTNRKFGFDTACGNISISDDGTADPTLLKGTTYVKNQLVGDSKVIKELGQGVVTSPYAVSGDIDHAYIKGRSLVKNQLVPASVEKEGSSSNGVVEVSDAVAGDALSLNMVSPRSVVVNQQVDASLNYLGNLSATYMTLSNDKSERSAVATIVSVNPGNGIAHTIVAYSGHVYMVCGYVTYSEAGKTVRIKFANNSSNEADINISSTSETFVSGKITATADATVIGVSCNTGSNYLSVGETFKLRDLQIIDLTQYFNGDQTLIDSIASWDDLVAYDPRFASYVEYNTGTVEGVQPTVKVSGKNLFNQADILTDVSGATYANGYYTALTSGYNSAYREENGGFKFYPKPNNQYTISFTGYTVANVAASPTNARLMVRYTDGTQSTATDMIFPADSPASISFTTDITKSVKCVYFSYGNTGTVYLKDFCIQEGTATAYEPYHDGGTAQAPAPLFAVGNAADEYDAVTGKLRHNVSIITLDGTQQLTTTSLQVDGYFTAAYKFITTSDNISVRDKISTIPTISPLDAKEGIWCNGLNNNYMYIRLSNTKCTDMATMTSYFTSHPLAIYYNSVTPTTSQSTPTQISLQSGINVAMQTDGGRTASSIALGYDGTSFDVPLTSGRTYITKINNATEVVTDGTTQHVTGGVDMIVDLTMLYNGVSNLITPITTWNALVADTGMYGSYTAYDVGSVVHSDQTEVRVTGKNLCDPQAIVNAEGVLQDDGSYYFGLRAQGIICDFSPAFAGQITISFSSKYESTTTGQGAYFRFDYTDGTVEGTGFPVHDGAFHPIVKTSAAGKLISSIRMTYSSANQPSWLKDIQIEVGSTATTYEPYYSGGTATAGLLKGVPGSVYDQLDAITGNVTTMIGSYTFTGNENWTVGTVYANSFTCSNGITNAYRLPYTNTPTFMTAGYTAVGSITNNTQDLSFCVNTTAHATNTVIFKDSSCATLDEFKAKIAGKTVYYRLATYTKSTTTPQPLTQSTGNLTVLQTAGTLPVPLDVRHAVSEWDEPIVRNCKYIFRDNGVDSLVTGSTTVTYKHVVGGEHKLINLTQWFGRNREPSIADFYKLFPTRKGADIPYDRGTILNYKGTGVRTIGFNAYNHATGTAVLLGGNKYQICGTYTSCSYTDQWGNAEELSIDDKGIFTPVNNGTLTVVGGNDTDTCVHLCWSGYKNYGEPDYEWFPYEEKGVEWDLSPWFPNGMNGAGVDWFQDMITNSKANIGTGYLVLDGSENWLAYDVSGTAAKGFYVLNALSNVFDKTSNASTLCGIALANSLPGMAVSISPYAECLWCGVSGTPHLYLVWEYMNDTPTDIQSLCYDPETGILDVDAFKEYLSQNPLVVMYSLKNKSYDYTQEVDVNPTQNFSYPVNDFGTEQSLPVNTLTLLTTDLDADIRYSLDFTRTVANYSKIEDSVKQLVEEKDNLARQDGNYGDKGGVFNYATQLLDPNAPPTEASYGNRTAAGDVSIADNGTADVTSLQGTTQIQNQLVHDTNMNTKSSVDGRLVLTDAVGGQLSRLEIHGGCVVHNQLVKESVEKTATGTGKLGVEDGVAGNAKSLVLTAPRSVVMNQLFDIDSVTGGVTLDGLGSNAITKSGDVLTINRGRYGSRAYFNNTQYNFSASRKILVKATVNLASQTLLTNKGYMVELCKFNDSTVYDRATKQVTEFDTDETMSVVLTVPQTETYLFTIQPVGNDGAYTNMTFTIKDIQLVDLTQYFNGNTTLINSINTWDDLVAYDSTFASYVPYDTGTVKGVQPTVRVNHTTNVACPVELFGVDDTVADTFDGVSGVLTRKMASVDLGTLNYGDYVAPDSSYPYGYAAATINNKARSGNYAICSKYQIAQNRVQKGVRTDTNSLAIYIQDDALTGMTGAQIASAMSGVYLYYELATPTTSQYTPTTIPTVDIYNTALQTAGTRPCGLSLTYDGKDQTIALNPSHTYVFNDNQEDDSLITGQSSIDAVGGEDQLVDITQFYNGDATKIANIHSWASLSTRFHRYRDLQPYNPGTVEPFTPTVRVFPNEHAYGILYDPSQNTPACQRVELNNGVLSEVASFDALSSHNCHNLYRCVMDDLSTRHINYYLDDTDSTKKYNGTRNDVTSDGTQATLTGADGDVMVELPVSYWDVDEDYNGTGKILYLMSDTPFMGSYYPAEIHDAFYVSPNGDTPRKQYIGAYRASICDENGNPLNTTEGALTQTTGTSSTNKARSIAGALPYVSVSLGDLTTRAGRNGASTVNTKLHQWLFLLMAVEKASLNTQLVSSGYSGGIQNAFCFWRKSGRVNAGNGTDSISAVQGTQDMDNFQSINLGSTKLQRDTLMDENGRYAWSVYNRTASSTRYFTDSATPSNGDPIYTASTGSATAGIVSSATLNTSRVIQFQYRGIENPFGEVWEFEHGIQKYQTGEMKSFKGTDNLTYTRDVINDGPNSRAWVNDGTVRWTTTGSLTTSTSLYSDPTLTTATTVKYKDTPLYKYTSEGYWETLATSNYTSTAQRTAANPVYTDRHKHWPLTGYDTAFDPLTFFYRKTGSAGSSARYVPDYYYNDGTTGDRVVSRGGYASYGALDGLGSVAVYYGLTAASVAISGRLSA